MKTDDLINALVADTRSIKPAISATMWLAIAAGSVLAAAAFAEILGLRPDFHHAITHSTRFVFKFAFALSLLIPALLIVQRLARPTGEVGRLKWLMLIPFALLATAVLIELCTVPANHWAATSLGATPGACLTFIPLLSAAPLVVLLFALRQGATASPKAAGAAAGLTSAAIAATLYASHCINDSPLYVAVWYVIGVAIVVAIGAAAGAKLLRW